ncbi:hypothetical protein MGMO_114c00020 [Methyloglobulus morosus KoM1]|uniref:Transposase n=1 Tax=Methyloglobulus morosus KoM1 TaxID=1116472 RepID=V5BYD3_9GAMM|nr:hypothetical protein MGMO_114c00020 [Methyloglobulus morosus KoM1]
MKKNFKGNFHHIKNFIVLFIDYVSKIIIVPWELSGYRLNRCGILSEIMPRTRYIKHTNKEALPFRMDDWDRQHNATRSRYDRTRTPRHRFCLFRLIELGMINIHFHHVYLANCWRYGFCELSVKGSILSVKSFLVD